MKKTNFILRATFVAIFTSAISAFGQETLIPSPVKDEQKLMVSIVLEISDGGKILTEKQDGFLLFPQTVITTLSPLLLSGARVTVIAGNHEIHTRGGRFIDMDLGLGALLLIKPIAMDVSAAVSLFSPEDWGENLFLLTSRGVLNTKVLTSEEDASHHRGDVVVDEYGNLVSVVLHVRKDESSNGLSPKFISRESVDTLLDVIQEKPPIPEIPEESQREHAEISLDTI